MTPDQFRPLLNFGFFDTGRAVLPMADPGGERVFGGQIMAQLIAAAQSGSDKAVKSLQVAFPRAGNPGSPLYLDLENTHDGRSVGHRRAVVWQGEEQNQRIVATGSLLTDRGDDGYDHQFALVDAGADPMSARPIEFAVIPGEARLISEVGLDTGDVAESELAFWMRCPDLDPDLSQAVIAYISDWPLIGTLLKAVPGVSERDAHVLLQTGVITHSLWFHQPFDVTGWLRVHVHGMRLTAGRGFGTGDVFTRSGSHVASFAQESVIRRQP